jgi:Fe2+ transport system protein FeoA
MGSDHRGLTTLDRLHPGDGGRIRGVAGDDALATRIMEMGVTPGAPFCFIGTAPLGDPVEIEIRHYRLSLRRSEAARVEVSLGD